jgi:hypothetical protein
MPDIAVRRATTEDVPAIRRIAHAGWRAAYGEFLPPPVLDRVHEEWHAGEDLRESVSSEDVAFLVATAAGGEEGSDEVLGYASGGIRAGTNVGVVGAL